MLLTHRYYDPGNGRFLTRDPIGYAGGLNLYSLGNYNPVNRSDPSGFKSDPDDPTGLPGDNDGQWGMTTGHPAMHHGTPESKRANAMTRSLLSTLWSAALGVFGPEGKLAEGAEEALQEARLAKAVLKTKNSWTLAEHAEKVMLHPRFGKFYKRAGTDEWWSVDTAGHGGSAFKVFQQTGRKLEWIADADKDGNFIRGKHKGPVGLTIPLSEFGH